MNETPENPDAGADPAEPGISDLHSRLTSIEERLDKAAAKDKPWWHRIEFIGAISATLITGIVSLTTVAVQEIAKNRELELARIQQQAAINQEYLDRAIQVHDDALKREFALDFYSQVVQDPFVRNWAVGQLASMRAQRQAAEARAHQERLQATYEAASPEDKSLLKDKIRLASQEAQDLEARARNAQRIVTVNNLIAPDHQTRWQAAEDLSTVWGKDPGLPLDLLRFVREHADDSLAIYNVVVVVEDLTKCCRAELRDHEQTVRDILQVAESSGGAKTRGKVQEIRGTLGQ